VVVKALDWRGAQVVKEVEAAAVDALQEFGLRLETAAKSELYKGHGVLTGTLRRSIHTGSPDYNWGADDEAPSESTSSRGGQEPDVKRGGGRLAIETGSGLEYAMAVHQGHGSFGGYHFMTNAFDRIKDQFVKILVRKVKGRLK